MFLPVVQDQPIVVVGQIASSNIAGIVIKIAGDPDLRIGFAHDIVLVARHGIELGVFRAYPVFSDLVGLDALQDVQGAVGSVLQKSFRPG